SLRLGGYVQPRFQSRLAGDLGAVDAATFRLRRARLTFDGRLGPRLGYKLQSNFSGEAVALTDAYVDVALVDGLEVRVGQTKVPFTRHFLLSSTRILFLERPTGLDNLRYDRDVGVWQRG